MIAARDGRVARVIRWLRQLHGMSVKELRQLFRDRVLSIWVVYIFSLNILLVGGAPSMELHQAALVVRDGDRTTASRELIHRFQPPYFILTGTVRDEREAQDLLDDGEAMVVLDVPENFAKTLYQGEAPASAQLLVDTSRSQTGYLAAAYAQRIATRYGGEWVDRNLARRGEDPARLPAIDNQRRVWFNPNLEESWFRTISELLTMMTVACLLLPAAALVREKERGTIEQLLVSPVSPLQVMLAKVTAMIFVMLAGTLIALFGVMRPVYGVPIEGSLTLLLVLTAVYTFTNAGLGLVIATFARNSAQSGMLAVLVVIPIVMLSGTWAPIESMPVWLRILMTLSPLRHFINIAYGILLRGEGLDLLWDSVLTMGVLGAVLFAISVRRFRSQFG